MAMKALFAVWGALANGSPTNALAENVTGKLQQFFNDGVTTITINDANFNDPAVGFTKHFGAMVDRGDHVSYYACQEGQTINFDSPSH
ncbi:MAG TPA: hypothetical protein VME47_12950 [Acetobacteraceae bacterium]|nr:hypothetical protein [Acetobacteraceae bacterium]